MEVLLLTDIDGIGLKDDLLVVGDGYALNYLLPQSKALIATPTVRRRYAERIRRRAVARETERQAQQTASDALSDTKLTFARKTTKAGKLYAAITEANISEALKEQHKMDIEASSVEIPDQIKAVGEFQVQLNLADNPAKITVVVSEEK